MNEVCRSAGMAVTKQALPASWQEAESFLKRLWLESGGLSGVRAVVKPRRGQASVGVFSVCTLEEAQAAYHALSAHQVSTDATEVESGAVVQEYMDGEEWIVDTVSRAGEHKVAALWRYDKGEANGAPFVYFGVEAMSSVEAHDLMQYAFEALDALTWRWGPAHIEIKRTIDGPRLVEANVGRWNGLDFKLIADLCYGCNAYDMAIAAYQNEQVFAALPTQPPVHLRCAGRIVTLVSSVSGSLVQCCHAEQLAQLQSLVLFEPFASDEGDDVRLTIDLDSSAGYAHLIHSDPAVVEADYGTLRGLQSSLFEVSSDMVATV